MPLQGWRMWLFLVLMGIYLLVVVIAAGWWQATHELPDRRMPGYKQWMREHRPGMVP